MNCKQFIFSGFSLSLLSTGPPLPAPAQIFILETISAQRHNIPIPQETRVGQGQVVELDEISSDHP
jgi:hypothetical protein